MVQPSNDQSTGTPSGTSRLTVPEAAQALGISPEAIRNRLSRGTLESVRENGRVFVLVDSDMARHTGDQSTGTPNDAPTREDEATAKKIADAKDETIRVLEDQLKAEREANRENRRIIAGLVQRVPELEASEATEPRESPVRASEGRVGTEAPPEQEQRRSWLHRFFFGP